MRSQIEIESRIDKLIRAIDLLEQKEEDLMIDSDDFVNGKLSEAEYDLLAVLNTELNSLWWVIGNDEKF
jgi:hypothetical protein